MTNPDQKTVLLEQAYDELKAICAKFQDESGATDMEVKTLLRELARVYEKELMMITIEIGRFNILWNRSENK